MSPRQELKPVRQALADSGIQVKIGADEWKFSPETNGNRHFWSTDDVECLWCGHRRSDEAIQAWISDGRPRENCVTILTFPSSKGRMG